MVGNISALSILFNSMDSKFAKLVMTGIYISILKEIKLRKQKTSVVIKKLVIFQGAGILVEKISYGEVFIKLEDRILNNIILFL